VDAGTRELVLSVLADEERSGFVVDRVRTAIAADPRVGGRLALWGRRLVGEALCQARWVVRERPAVAALLPHPGEPAGDAPARVFAGLTAAHSRRMAALGLAA
jgi:hypothetical protein